MNCLQGFCLSNGLKYISGTALAVILTAGSAPAPALSGDPVLINEVLASHTSTDNTEFVELFGIPGTSLDGLSLIVVESDAFSPGTIDRRIDFGANDVIGSNSFFLVGNPSGLLSNYAVTPNIDVADNFLENSSLTVAVVETASIAGTSVSGGEVVRDAVALNDGDAGDVFFFNPPVIGPDGPFFPAGAGRINDGVDTDTAADWLFADFNLGSANTPTSGDVPPPSVIAAKIYDIQGAVHVSPLDGSLVETTGVVTAVAFNGFYMQDPEGDNNPHTSDAVFVFTGTADKPTVGDLVEVTGSVSEYIPGGAATGNLSTTQLSPGAEGLVTLAIGNSLPEAIVIGRGGRVPPNETVISAAELPVNLQNASGAAGNPFNPDIDGIDFYESLEAMRVTLEDPVAVSATRTFSSFSSEFFTLANNGADAAPADARTSRGGISLQPHPDNRGDQNPERVQVQLDGTLFPGEVPAIKVGDRLGNVTGVVGYSFGNFEVNATEVFDIFPGRLKAEKTRIRHDEDRVTVASYNVLNLSPLPVDDNQRATLARHIIHNLKRPDIVALQEIQDNNGDAASGPDGVVDADETLQALIDAIRAIGGPKYRYFDVAPAEATSGGIPGGNIRNAFLYDPRRVELVSYVSLTPDVLTSAGVGDPSAFTGTRNPLAATFASDGLTFTVINNHLTSRFGSSPVFGGVQPFVQAGETEREAQAQALNDYVDYLLALDADAPVIVLGDLNTFEFTNDLAEILPGTGDETVLFNLTSTLEDANVYSFIFDGNSQVLDHAFVTRNLVRRSQYDIVHVNVDYPRIDDTVGSDHEPLLISIDLDNLSDDDESSDD